MFGMATPCRPNHRSFIHVHFSTFWYIYECPFPHEQRAPRVDRQALVFSVFPFVFCVNFGGNSTALRCQHTTPLAPHSERTVAAKCRGRRGTKCVTCSASRAYLWTVNTFLIKLTVKSRAARGERRNGSIAKRGGGGEEEEEEAALARETNEIQLSHRGFRVCPHKPSKKLWSPQGPFKLELNAETGSV